MHAVKVYEQGRFTVFWAALTGGRGVVDIHLETQLITDRTEIQRASQMVSQTADDVEDMLGQNIKKRMRGGKAT